MGMVGVVARGADRAQTDAIVAGGAGQTSLRPPVGLEIGSFLWRDWEDLAGMSDAHETKWELSVEIAHRLTLSQVIIIHPVLYAVCAFQQTCPFWCLHYRRARAEDLRHLVRTMMADSHRLLHQMSKKKTRSRMRGQGMHPPQGPAWSRTADM